MRHNQFAAFVLFDFGGVFQYAFQRAEHIDQFGGSFQPDAGNAGDVVGGIAGQGLHVGNAFGINAEFFFDVFGSEKLVFHAVVEFDAGAYQLHQVLIGGDDSNVFAFF